MMSPRVRHSTRTVRPRTLILVTALLPLLVLLAAPVHGDDVKEDRDNNFSLSIPLGWDWAPYSDKWKENGIVAGAIRELEKLKDGSTGSGQGGMLHLSIVDAPEGKELAELAKSESVRAYFLKRLNADPEQWGALDLETEEYELDDGLKLLTIRVECESRNLKGSPGKTKAVLVLAIAKKKLFRLRMYVWLTEFDDEGLSADLDFIENDFIIMDPTPDEAETPAYRPPDEDEEPEFEGDEGEEVVYGGKPGDGYRLVKPIKIRSKTEFDRDANPGVVAWFEANSVAGYYRIMLYSHPRDARNAQGQQVATPDIKMRITKSWWKLFTANRTEGPLTTYKWPKRSPKASFITLPLFDQEIMIASKPSRRPRDPGPADIIKLGIVEKVKGRLGKRKVSAAYRGSMGGIRPRSGKEIEIRFSWGTVTHVFEMTVLLTRDWHVRWEKELRQLLESVEVIK